MSTLEQVSAVAQEAFIYGYPIVDNHNVIHRYVLDKANKEYKGPFNQVGHNRDVVSPEDAAVVSMNVDTTYSFAWLDLRAEPVVLTIPRFEPERYVSVELIDLYTYIVGYISPRTNGNAGGDFLVAGPGWQGEAPAGVKTVFRSPTQFLLALSRTQLFDASDLPNVHHLENPIHRYVINSPMLPSLRKDPNGGFTLFVQHESPGKDLEANWLPVSRDAFNLAFRTYQPDLAIQDGSWQAPPVVRVD